MSSTHSILRFAGLSGILVALAVLPTGADFALAQGWGHYGGHGGYRGFHGGHGGFHGGHRGFHGGHGGFHGGHRGFHGGHGGFHGGHRSFYGGHGGFYGGHGGFHGGHRGFYGGHGGFSGGHGGHGSYSAAGHPDERYLTSTGAWTHLAEGNPHRALQMFARQAESNPTSGEPKVGYALAVAATGDLGRGVWAMRRACRVDPESMHYLAIDEAIEPTIDRLVDAYETGAVESPFMLASLHYLRGDVQSASDEIDRALDAGDRAVSTQNLKDLVDRQLADAPTDGGPPAANDEVSPTATIKPRTGDDEQARSSSEPIELPKPPNSDDRSV